MAKSSKKRIALVVLALFILFMGFTLMLESTHHHPHGLQDNCAICLFLHYSQQILKNGITGSGFAYVFLMWGAFVYGMFFHILPLVVHSPVSLKVKMNN